MRILVLAPYAPFPPRSGGAQRMFQLLRGLAARHDVTCLTFAADAAAAQALEPLRRYCRLEVVFGPPRRSLAQRALTTLASPLPDMALRNASRAYAEQLQALCRAQRFDLVQAESIEMARYLPLVRELHSGGTRPLLLLDEFNAEYLLQRRTALQALKATLATGGVRNGVGALYSLVQWRKLAHYERRALGFCNGVFVVSHQDRAALARLDPWARSFVVPNGVDCAYFAPRPALADTPTLVFTATMDYRPNVDAARWFVRDVLPQIKARHPEVQLRLVGRAPTAEVRALADDSLVIVTGEVADVRPEIARAAVYVVPMRIGGGVRLKLLEALAMQVPVVSTPLGAEGVDELRDGEHCLLADDANAFARAVVQLLDDPVLARRLSVAGRRLVLQGYDWSAIVPRAEAAYARLG